METFPWDPPALRSSGFHTLHRQTVSAVAIIPMHVPFFLVPDPITNTAVTWQLTNCSPGLIRCRFSPDFSGFMFLFVFYWEKRRVRFCFFNFLKGETVVVVVKNFVENLGLILPSFYTCSQWINKCFTNQELLKNTETLSLYRWWDFVFVCFPQTIMKNPAIS